MLVTMSDKELNRINVIQSVVEKRMRRRDAAHQLALTELLFIEPGAAVMPETCCTIAVTSLDRNLFFILPSRNPLIPLVVRRPGWLLCS